MSDNQPKEDNRTTTEHQEGPVNDSPASARSASPTVENEDDDEDMDLDDELDLLDDQAFGSTDDVEQLRRDRQEELDRQMALCLENELKGNTLGLRSSSEEVRAPIQQRQRPITAFFPPEPTPSVTPNSTSAPPATPHFDFSSLMGSGNLFEGLASGMATTGGSGDEILRLLDRWKTDDSLVARLESKYGSTHPTFHIDSARGALARAKREFKMLMVYLHHDDHENTDLFCFNLCSPALSEFINENFVLWIGEINVPLEQVQPQLAMMGVTNFPFLALLADLGGGSISVIEIIQGLMGEDELMVRLLQVIDNQGALLEKMRNEHAQRESVYAADRDIKMQQEEAYHAALQEDMERQRQEEEEQIREAQRLSEMEAKKSEKERKRELLPPEPSKGTPESTHLVIRLPSGSRLERRFMKTDTLQTVRDFIESKVKETGFEADHYTISSAYPRKTFTDSTISLENAGLFPQAVLHIAEE